MYPKIFYGPPHVRVKYSIALTKVQHTLWTSSPSIHWSDVQSAKRHSQFTDAPKQVGACAKKAGGKFKQPKSKMTAQEYIRPLDHQHSSITTQTPCPHGGGPQHSSNSRWRRWPFWGFTSRPGAPTPCWSPPYGRWRWSTFFWPQPGSIWIRLETLEDHKTYLSCMHTLGLLWFRILPQSFLTLPCRRSGWVVCTCSSSSKLWFKHWSGGRGGR